MSNRKRRTEAINLVRSIDRDAILKEIHEQAESEFEHKLKSDFFRVFSMWILTLAFIGLIFSLALISSSANGEGRPKASDRETTWSKYLAAEMKGKSEVTLPDRSRCDILTESTAWEVEWVDKWEESIAQSINYQIESKRQFAGVIILLRGDYEDDKNRFEKVIKELRKRGTVIRFRYVNTEDENGKVEEDSEGDSGSDN